MSKLLLSLLFCCCLVQAQDAPPASAKLLWRASLATLATANALDIQSSWGKHELNPALAAPNATFGGQGALIKLGFVGAVAGMEFLVTRRRPSSKLYKVLGAINFGAAGIIGATAGHNYTVATSTR